MTHSQALLPDPCLMQVDNSCLFCSALKIRWLLALFPHVEELTLSHILLCLPLSYTSRLRPSSPCFPWPQCSVGDDGVLCSSRKGHTGTPSPQDNLALTASWGLHFSPAILPQHQLLQRCRTGFVMLMTQHQEPPMPVTVQRCRMLSGQLGFGWYMTRRHSTVKGVRLLSFLWAGF